MTEKAKRVYLYFVMAATLLPAFFVVPMPTTSSFSAVTLWGSAVAGYIGVVFMLWMYAIGTRAASSLFFIEQARLVAVHRWLGKYGTLLIFLHPVLITLSYGEHWFYSLVPSLINEYEKHVTYGRIGLYALLIVWLTSAIARSRLSYRTWKYLHIVSYIAVPFALLHIPEIGVSYAAELAARVYFYMIVGGFAIFSVLRARDLLLFTKHSYSVGAVKEVTPGVYQLDLNPDERALDPQAGQYVYIKQSFFGEEHPFSVLRYDKTSQRISVAFKVVGPFTRSLAKLEVGESVLVSGPIGRFTTVIDDQGLNPVVYIAGGIGITPFVERILTQAGQREQWLFYAARGPEFASYEAPLTDALGQRMISVYSEAERRAGTRGHRGLLRADLLTHHLQDATRFSYFICGPSAMMDATKRELVMLGVASQNIYTEDFSF